MHNEVPHEAEVIDEPVADVAETPPPAPSTAPRRRCGVILAAALVGIVAVVGIAAVVVPTLMPKHSDALAVFDRAQTTEEQSLEQAFAGQSDVGAGTLRVVASSEEVSLLAVMSKDATAQASEEAAKVCLVAEKGGDFTSARCIGEAELGSDGMLGTVYVDGTTFRYRWANSGAVTFRE